VIRKSNMGVKMTVELNEMARNIWDGKYAAFKGETYEQGCKRVADYLQVPELENLLKEQRFSVGGRVWYGAGKTKPLLTNCALFNVTDSAQGWAELLHDVTLALTSGMGIGVSYDAIRPYGSIIKSSGGTASGAVSVMEMVNEVARHIMQGNTRRSAAYASLHWKHGDIDRFISAKNWDTVQQYAKSVSFTYPATLDLTNISVRFDKDFLKAMKQEDYTAESVYHQTLYNMFRYSEPGIQYDNDDQILRNA
jgi:ribonucleoside-diphosphate reductase alpha chain